MAPVHGLLLVYRRCMAGADVSSLVRFGQMMSNAVISHTVLVIPASTYVRPTVVHTRV